MMVTLASLFVGGTAFGGTPGARAMREPTLEASAAVVFRLKNGLTVILQEDHAVPLVALSIWYGVGAADDPPGRSGLAHLFEHLMFGGSLHVNTDFGTLVESAGATNVNGTTSWDRTSFFETVPPEQLETMLWMESDRMGFTARALTAERLGRELNIVARERQNVYESSAQGVTSLLVLNTLFPPGHPYHGGIIGLPDELRSTTLDDARSFCERYYTPANASVAVVGDFDPGETRRHIERYFGSLPRRPLPPRAAAPPARPALPSRIVVELSSAHGQVTFGYLAPPAYTPESTALEVGLEVLAGGRAGRVPRALEGLPGVVSDVQASFDTNRLASMVLLGAAGPSRSIDAVEYALDRAIAEFAAGGPTDRELQRAKRRMRIALHTGQEALNGPTGDTGRAGLLQRFHFYLGTPNGLPERVRALDAVTAGDVRRAVAEFLHPARRATVVARSANDLERMRRAEEGPGRR